MCQTCITMANMDVPPWLWEPGMTWCKKRHLQLQGRDVSPCPYSKFAMSNNNKFIDEIVKTHNEYRSKHQAPPLRHSKELTAEAQRWADHLAATNTFQHSNVKIGGQKLGENIAMKWSSKPDAYTGKEVSDQWYSEVKMHQFGNEPRVLNSGHFTQMVWKNSKEIGIGRSQTGDGKILVVANYRPAGNVVGTFSQNVLPPKDGKIVLPVSRDAITLRGVLFHVVESLEAKKVEIPSKTGDDELIGTEFDSSKLIKGRPSPFSSQERSAGMSRQTESRSTRTYTVTEGSGPNAVTKTVVEETIIKADGSKVTNKTETVTRGDAGGASSRSLFDREKDKDKDKKGGFGGDMPAIGHMRLDENDFFRGKGKHDSSSDEEADIKRKPQKLSEFVDDCVKAHNVCRKKHGVGSVEHKKDLSEYAQKWAEHLAATNGFQHSDCMHKGNRLGENIACKWSSGGGDYTGQEVTEQWYSEIKKHDFGGEPRTTGTGHFTQVVWKGTKEVGFGKAKTSGGKVIVVGSYRPAGNLIGSYTENVPPPKK